jgi:arylsulfatase A-like enzyme
MNLLKISFLNNEQRISKAKIMVSALLSFILLWTACGINGKAAKIDKATPNIIIVMTDDQGYGDLSAHGNPIIETPNLDYLYANSVRFENFHVNPTCAPTRAALMTGKYNHRVGVWHTVLGLERVRQSEQTMADIFSENGYTTGIFGKWHLGDDYPFRPNDRGFQESVVCKAGSVNQMADYWDNDRMNDTYFHNDLPEKYKGYSADVFFDEAMDFMNKNKDKPFFTYIPTSAPHGPFNVLQEWADKYEEKGLNPEIAAFYASIERVDFNMGRLMKFLQESGLVENTLVIFLTDNGTARLNKYNTAGMKGAKGSVYEGGHRVPLFFYAPQLGFIGGKAFHQPVSVMDLLPTFIDLCHLKMADNIQFDGQSLMPILSNKPTDFKKRSFIIENQRLPHPVKWRRCVVIKDQWRLVNGKELYNVENDLGQKKDLAAQYPTLVQTMRKEYEAIWEEISAKDQEYQRLILGSSKNTETRLTAIDWYWKNNNDKQNLIVGQESVRNGKLSNGIWPVEIAETGNYEFELRRWPIESGLPLNGTTPEKTSATNDIALKKYGSKPKGKVLNIIKAKVTVNEITKEINVNPSAESVKINLTLEKGLADVQTWFYTDKGKELGAYYVYVRKR